jgi:hypothetical protein
MIVARKSAVVTSSQDSGLPPGVARHDGWPRDDGRDAVPSLELEKESQKEGK